MTHLAKLARGEEHLDALASSFDAFIKSDPYRLTHDYVDGNSALVIHVKVVGRQPSFWPELAGDCIHNIRASLDHLIWSLTERVTPSPKHPKTTAFPICDTAGEFHTRREKMIGQTPSGVWQVVE